MSVCSAVVQGTTDLETRQYVYNAIITYITKQTQNDRNVWQIAYVPRICQSAWPLGFQGWPYRCVLPHYQPYSSFFPTTQWGWKKIPVFQLVRHQLPIGRRNFFLVFAPKSVLYVISCNSLHSKLFLSTLARSATADTFQMLSKDFCMIII